MIWIENIKQFFVENSTTILSYLTPANIAATIAAVIIAIRNNKATKKTTEVGANMTDSAGKIANVAEVVADNTAKVNEVIDRSWDLDSKVKSLYCRIESVENTLLNRYDEIQDKIFAILDVQSMVYGTIQDDELRANVQNKIATARLSSDHTRDKLLAELSGLREEVATKVNAVAEAVSEGVKQIESVTEAAKTKKKTSRY